MLTQLITVVVLTVIIHMAETLSYSIRYAGVKINKIAVALSLSGIVVLVSRTANLIQAPITAGFIDHAKNDASFHLIGYLRFTLFGAAIGTLIAIALFPTFVNLFTRIILKLEVAGSIPKLLTSVTVNQLRNTKYYVRRPSLKALHLFRFMGIPKRFIILNTIVTGLYTVGVLASLYAAYLFPANSIAASQASGIINGIATVILTVFIDPQLGLIMDKAMRDDEERMRLGKVYNVMMTSRFAGTMLAQLLLVPAAYWIGIVVNFI